MRFGVKPAGEDLSLTHRQSSLRRPQCPVKPRFMVPLPVVAVRSARTYKIHKPSVQNASTGLRLLALRFRLRESTIRQRVSRTHCPLTLLPRIFFGSLRNINGKLRVPPLFISKNFHTTMRNLGPGSVTGPSMRWVCKKEKRLRQSKSISMMLLSFAICYDHQECQ
nr:MAG TPA: hypothetical protein [Caudoviricetes sp.]